MRYSCWEEDDVNKSWPPGSWADLLKIAHRVEENYLVVDLQSPAYRELRLRIRDDAIARAKQPEVSTASKVRRLAHSVARDPVGMVRSAAPEEVRHRLGTCAWCEWCDPLQLGCKICGCKFKQKLTRQSNSCPIHQWTLARGQELTVKEQKERDKELAKAKEKYYVKSA